MYVDCSIHAKGISFVGNENENAPLKNSMDNNNDGPSLRMLKLIYGDLTSDLLENLKDSSRKEVCICKKELFDLEHICFYAQLAFSLWKPSGL